MKIIQKVFYVYFIGAYMNKAGSNTAMVKPQAAAETRQVVLKEITAKWGKFSEQDLSGLKGRDDLVAQLAAKYSLENGQAQRDVDALLKGRQI
jgi:hypothetical protein